MTVPRIGFAGMTHLGIVSAAAAAHHGCKVIGFDTDAARISALSAGSLPIFEPDLDDVFRTHAARLSFTGDLATLAQCDVVYVAPDVPTDDAGRSDLSGIRALIDAVASLCGRFTMVVLSQVPPGFTRSLPPRSGPVYYQVETLVFGNAVERGIRPERFIVGCADPASPLPPPYAAFLERFGRPILPMRYESAELAKIAINCCLVSMVSTANTLAELCEGIGADWSEIVPALRLDRRIGPYSYLEAGLGIAGGNLERDLATVQDLAANCGSDSGVVAAWVANSRHRRDWPLRLLRQNLLSQKPNACIGILGLAYKQDTHSIKNSAAVALIDSLGSARLRSYDPVVPDDAVCRANLVRVAAPLQAAEGADALVLMTPWPSFRELDPAELAARMTGNVVIDPYRLLDPAACRRAGLTQCRLGAS